MLIPIADAANRDGDHAHPGKEAIMEGSLYSRSAVTDAIRRLLIDRWIEVEEWGRGRGQATVYRVLMGREPSTAEPVLTRPKAPQPGPKERAKSWPLSAMKEAEPGAAASGLESGHGERDMGPEETRKAAGVPTWNSSPTVTLSTETLPTRGSRRVPDDASPPDIRAGFGSQEPQDHPGADLLAAVAAAAPPTCRHELLTDPDQDAGRAALRRRLVTLAAEVGPDAAVSIVAGEWPTSVTSAMAHANARARDYIERRRPAVAANRFASADPLEGVADATAAIAERARAREAEFAGLSPAPPPPDWKTAARMKLYPADVEAPAATGARS